MLNRYFADYITNLLNREGIIQDFEIPLYHYGFELLLSSVFNAVWILMWGFITERKMLAIVYIVILATVRTQIGGYHANSYRKCFLCYSLAFLTVIVMVEMCGFLKLPLGFLGFVSIVLLIIEFFWAPVLHTKILTQEEKKTSRKKGIGRTVIWVVIMHFVYWYNIKYAYQIFCVLLLCIILMIVEKYLQKRKFVRGIKNNHRL